MAILTSVALQHITRIRQEQGLSDGASLSRNTRNLETALVLLAEQLYQNSTHFLAELIQNADDNDYEAPHPAVTLTFQNRCLRIDCNEKGFSERNVEAICSIGFSTKAGGSQATRYVGEKGIGFKSVFKVADVVWISSRSYSFKFDKRTPLGMIAPLWAEFPQPVVPGCTSMFMQLSPDYNELELLDELRSFDPRMMMFLRKLLRINITIHGNDGSVWTTSLARREGVFRTQLRQRGIELMHDSNKLRYVVSSHIVTGLPAEPKREGHLTSELLLAFPWDDGELPPQKVYAFLPIRDFGFRFLLQGDFLLIASREDIDASSQWNRALRSAVIDAFVVAAKNFHLGPLQYRWPRYLPIQSSVNPFFDEIKIEILRALQHEAVLENRSGQLSLPTSLIYVPEEFCDANGVPLTASVDNEHKYLSAKYHRSDWDYLSEIGVEEMDEKEFLIELSEYIANFSHAFQHEQSAEWQAKVAQILMKMAVQQQYLFQISQLHLIPLEDGHTWVSAAGKTLFLPPETENCTSPGGIDILLVNTKAVSDPIRRALYKLLGVRDFSAQHICDLIVGTHSELTFDPSSVSLTDLISQAVFLYKSDWRNNNRLELWFAAEDGRRLQGSKLYLDSVQSLSATTFFSGHRIKFPFLHRQYATRVTEGGEQWVTWLKENLSVAVLPRLALSDAACPENFQMAPDAEHIIKHNPTSQFLLLLRDHWRDYSPWLEEQGGEAPNSRRELSRKTLVSKLKSTEVQCHGGARLPLSHTCLPLKNMMDEADGRISFLDVTEPGDPRWEKFKLLGVTVNRNVSFYLRCLESLEGTHDPLEKAIEFMEQIQARYTDDEELVKNNLTTRSLICLPPLKERSPPRWVKPKDCLWSGPKCLRRFVPLKNIYPACKRLFCDILGLSNAQASDFVREARALKTLDSLEDIKDLFLEMEKFLQEDETESSFGLLRSNCIFPIRNIGTASGYTDLRRTEYPPNWFIADRVHLEESFRGRIPLLAFSVEDVSRMTRLLKKLGVEGRKLTKAARSIPTTRGAVSPDEVYKDSLLGKVDFILRLIPDTETGASRRLLIRELRNLQVFTAEAVIQDWTVRVRLEEVSGRSSAGHVVLAAEEDRLRIYLARNYLTNNRNLVELVDELASFCNIPKEHSLLLNMVLTEDSIARIEEMFQIKGIPRLRPDEYYDDNDDSSDDEAYYHNAHAQVEAPPGTGSGSSGPRFPTGPDFLRDLIAALAADFMVDRFRMGPPGTPSTNASGSTIYTPQSSMFDPEDQASDISDIAAHPFFQKLDGIRVFSSRRRSQISRSQIEGQQRIDFDGELLVSRLLERLLGTAYTPNRHWTSRLRQRAGHSAYTADADAASTFTVPDDSGRFTTFLAHCGHEDARGWRVNPPVYHLEVKTTQGPLGAEFCLTNAEFERARKFTLAETSDHTPPKDVSILVRVFNIDEQARLDVEFLPDLWDIYLGDDLSLKAVGGYRGQVKV